MAEEALNSFEMTADWKTAYNAAVEFAIDEWEIEATQAQAATAVSIAQSGWQGIKNCVQQVHYHPQY
jgi:hypothetical protein